MTASPAPLRRSPREAHLAQQTAPIEAREAAIRRFDAAGVRGEWREQGVIDVSFLRENLALVTEAMRGQLDHFERVAVMPDRLSVAAGVHSIVESRRVDHAEDGETWCEWTAECVCGWQTDGWDRYEQADEVTRIHCGYGWADDS